MNEIKYKQIMNVLEELKRTINEAADIVEMTKEKRNREDWREGCEGL